MSYMQRGNLRAQPHIPKGARPFPRIMVTAIAENRGSSTCWWKRMVSVALSILFETLLRGAGLLCIPSGGTTWLVGEHEFINPATIPYQCSGVALTVPRRKSTQTRAEWVVIRAGRTPFLLKHHVEFIRVHAPANECLFPARKQVGRGRSRIWAPHPSNPMSTHSLLGLMRMALREVCGLSAVQAAMFTLHALRVGGINYLHRMGVPTSMRAQMASHAALETSCRYLRLSPLQQLQTLNRYVQR